MTDDRRLDLEEIRALIALAVASDIVALEVEAPHLKVKIKKAGARGSEAHAPAAGPSRSSGTRRGATPARTSRAASACPIPKATGRPCA